MKKLFILGICLVMLLSISAVCASENETISDLSYDNVETAADYDSDFDDGQEIYIIADDLDLYYSKTYCYIVSLEDDYGDPVDYVDELKVRYSNGIEEIAENDGDGDYLFDMDWVGNRKATIILDDSYYRADPVTINVKISKSPVKIAAKKYYSNTKQYTTLKATVKDSDGEKIDEGTVKFKVSGKTYNVKVKNGVASKKIKLKNAKTYTYSATYIENRHYKKSKTATSKLHVYSCSKKARTFAIKGYKVTLNQKQYNKLINAKNTNKLVCFQVKTNKYVKQYYPVSKKSYRAVNARVSILFAYGGKNGGQYGWPNKYSITLNTPYQNPGYDGLVGWVSGTKISSELNKLNSAKIKYW